MPDAWRYVLYGGYTIEPGPTRDLEMLDVGLYRPDGPLVTTLPTEFHRLMNFGNYSMVAVTQDRFRIALIGQRVQRTPESRVKGGWDLFILAVAYDGSILNTTPLVRQPGGAGRIRSLSPGATVSVVAAAEFHQSDEGAADYWYQVECASHTGWVFGGDLLIEGNTWEDRLEVRGRPMSIDELLAGVGE